MSFFGDNCDSNMLALQGIVTFSSKLKDLVITLFCDSIGAKSPTNYTNTVTILLKKGSVGKR